MIRQGGRGEVRGRNYLNKGVAFLSHEVINWNFVWILSSSSPFPANWSQRRSSTLHRLFAIFLYTFWIVSVPLKGLLLRYAQAQLLFYFASEILPDCEFVWRLLFTHWDCWRRFVQQFGFQFIEKSAPNWPYSMRWRLEAETSKRHA